MASRLALVIQITKHFPTVRRLEEKKQNLVTIRDAIFYGSDFALKRRQEKKKER